MFHCMYPAWTAHARNEAATAGGISVTQSTHHVVMWEEITAVTLCPLQSVGVLRLPPVRSLYWTRCGGGGGCRFNVPIIPFNPWSQQTQLITTLCELPARTSKPTTPSPHYQILKQEKYFAIKCSATFERTLLFESHLGFAPSTPSREQHADKNEYVTFVEWYWQGKAEVPEENPVLLPLIFRHNSYTAWPVIETEILVICS
jgi:hypothetical protein